ncbi:ATP-dependent helicase [Nitrosophilus kaiyonis]|uniref:ATP-dependent helicase n=1 Tax=Nitrosophilus kaiyonis TaxID=2930200 RepID=UPI0024924E8F|nr:ATP-dependent helicase [Nitrosophilus kaiyonis]
MPISRLNEEQFKAATAPFGYNLVIASAGTGKTSTIVGRIGYLLDKNILPENILLLTFTNKAAAEMIGRVAKFFGNEKAKKIESGTFHAVCYRWLKNIDENIVLKQPKELKTLFRSIYEKRNFINFEEKPYKSSYLYDLYSLYQNSVSSLSFGEWIAKKNELHISFIDIYNDIVDEFEVTKEKYGFVSFNDLLIFAKKRANKIKEFDEILIDEYQDTNNLQSSLIDSLKSKSLFCVGDYDQSIYAFNGANINIIANFKKRYKDARVFNLSKNYRSTKYILNLANKVILNNERIYPKKLEVVRKDEYEKPKLLIYDELMEQYKDIAKRIKNSTTKYEEIAVIFRNNSSADGIEASLREFGINCKRRGSISFFDAKEIKIVFEMISLLINPKDVMSFIHIFEYAKGVGPSIAKEIYDGLEKLGERDPIKGLLDPIEIKNPFERKIKNHQLGLFDDFLLLGSKSRFKDLNFEENFYKSSILTHPKLSVDGAKFLYDLYKLYKDLKKFKQPLSIVSKIVDSDLYIEIRDVIAKKRATLKDGTIDKNLYDEQINKIFRKTLLLKELAKPYKDIERFYNAMILGSNEISEGVGVNLLTVHASKGLEFDDVYIVDLADGRFPNRKLISKTGSLEEERRLFYVAATRAKNRLFLSYAKYDRVKKMEFKPSPFLFEAGLI